MYSLHEYGQMIADKGRTEAYAEAIARAVRPGDVAVDLGSGVGFFALLACRAGARRVYAIEAADAVQWGKQFAAANGFSDRIEFLQGDSRQINLPESANLLISDLRGALPFFRDAIPSIEDARQRFLAPDGRLIPQLDKLYAAIVDATMPYATIMEPWRNSPCELDLSSILPALLNTGHGGGRFSKSDLLTEPQEWCRLEYAMGPSKRAAANIQFRTFRSGTGHGIWIWFDTQLFEDIGFTTGPEVKETIYGRILLPWPEPVSLKEGQRIEVELHADSVGGPYIWRWDTHFREENGQTWRDSFRQSTFQSAKFSHSALRRRSADFVPVLTEQGQAQSWMLQAMDGKTSLEEIAREVVGRFPRAFRDEDDALRVAGELSEKFTQ